MSYMGKAGQSEMRSEWLMRLGVGLVVALFSVVGGGVWRAGSAVLESLHQLVETQAVMQSQVVDIRGRLSGLYTQREADRDRAIIYRTDRDQYQRIVAMEKALASIVAIGKD